MNCKINNKNNIVRPTHNPMDKFLKAYSNRFGNILLEQLGYDFRIDYVCPNELIDKSNEYRADFIGYSRELDMFVLMEFESGKHKTKDDERYTNYGKFIRDKYHKCVYTLIISVADGEEERRIEYKIGEGINYPMDLKTFNKFEGDKEYEKIKNKKNLEEIDIANLIILPLMKNKDPIGEVILKACKLTNQIKSKINPDDLELVKTSQKHLTEYFLDKTDEEDLKLINKIEEEIKMTFVLFEETFKEARLEGERQGLIKGERQGLIKGEKQGLIKGVKQGIFTEKENIAKSMLLDGETIEKIAKHTKLNLKQIEKIAKSI